MVMSGIVFQNQNDSLAKERPVLSDTLCLRNSIADITYHDPYNLISSGKIKTTNNFPFIFTGKNKVIEQEKREILERSLKEGIAVPDQARDNDWIILVLIGSVLLFTFIRTTMKKGFMSVIRRFFMLRLVSEPAKRQSSGLFEWQSLALTFIAFMSVSLFIYRTFSDSLPVIVNGTLTWLIILGLLSVLAATRYVICVITGKLSGTASVFREYLFGVRQFYMIGSYILFAIVVLMSFTFFFPPEAGFIAGSSAMAILYLIRVIRLLVIFIKSGISILYFILYLWALEIMPVLIAVKFLSGLE